MTLQSSRAIECLENAPSFVLKCQANNVKLNRDDFKLGVANVSLLLQEVKVSELNA